MMQKVQRSNVNLAFTVNIPAVASMMSHEEIGSVKRSQFLMWAGCYLDSCGLGSYEMIINEIPLEYHHLSPMFKHLDSHLYEGYLKISSSVLNTVRILTDTSNYTFGLKWLNHHDLLVTTDLILNHHDRP